MRIMDEVKREYRNNVQLMRLRAGIPKQKELASRTGIRASTLSEIESNQVFLSSAYALRIAEVLGCKIDELFEKRPQGGGQ